CTGCHYCMPCPAGVDIPACFTAYNTRHSISKSQGLIQYYMGTLMSDRPGYAGLCRECGKCEQHCPQGLPIRDSLKAVSREFEGPLFKGAKAVMPLFVRKKKT
ncbi:MAG: 4Fe-4S dicluster domain-containing protein, partial [Lachnospiraceae bacterium]|nr:4Fe-4S dicluster domain-containing protein [Lachnospiraceae bacterium]